MKDLTKRFSIASTAINLPVFFAFDNSESTALYADLKARSAREESRSKLFLHHKKI